MESAKSPEFLPESPLSSAASVLYAIFFTPREFYRKLDPVGSMREPTLFVLAISAVTGLLGFAADLLRGSLSGVEGTGWIAPTAALNASFVVLSPVLVGVVSALYLLATRALVSREAQFRTLYRMFAYGWGAMILFWVPVIQAFALAYAAVVLMIIGVWGVYRAPFITALVVAVSGFVPLGVAMIGFISAINGVIAG